MMQDIFGSVRRSFIFRHNPQAEDPGAGGGGVGLGIAEKIGSCLRKSRVGPGGLGLGFLPRFHCPTPSVAPVPSAASAPPPTAQDNAPAIRWRKGELVGCGAFGHVYMGMNLDSGELIAVKQVLVGSSNASKQKAQDNIRELEEEVKLLKNLSHQNIVRYLGTAREEETLNILLEFVPGGSISSLLGKFGSFPESVIRMYTKQLLQGLEYLHQNGIIHRDIKGANILVDNRGCIKLADFGASKQVARLATLNAAKSMKGTPYWMAPEVIIQTGHSFSADIWSVGCTVIEMATGKPPWSQQYQEVAVLYHIGTTKSHPPIPEHLSLEAKDFLLKCLKREPNLRPTASDLLQHPFVTGEHADSSLPSCSSVMKPSSSVLQQSGCDSENLLDPIMWPTAMCGAMRNVDDFVSRSCSTDHEKLFSARPIWEMDSNNDNDEMCQLGEDGDLPIIRQSFNPMSEPLDGDQTCNFDTSLIEQGRMNLENFDGSIGGTPGTSGKGENDFTFPYGPVCEDDDEATEIKIRAFLDEKARELKKLQTPLYEEFYNTMNASKAQDTVTNMPERNVTDNSKLPPKCRPSLSRPGGRPFTPQVDLSSLSPGRDVSGADSDKKILREIPSPGLNEWEGLLEDTKRKPTGPSDSFCERRRKWKEELDQELQNQREMLRQAGVGGRMSSPKEKYLSCKGVGQR